MTTRYSDRGTNILFQDPEGPFVHYLDYEKLVSEIRDTILDFDHQKVGPRIARRLEKVLIGLGEEI